MASPENSITTSAATATTSGHVGVTRAGACPLYMQPSITITELVRGVIVFVNPFAPLALQIGSAASLW